MSKATMTIEGYAAEPRLNRTNSGKSVLSVKVAHSWSKKLDDGTYEDVGGTTWAEATFWEGDADYWSQRISKGSYVLLSGDPEVKTYEGKNGTGVTVVLRNPTIGVQERRARGSQSSQGATGGAWSGQQQQDQPWAPQGAQQPQNDVWSTDGGTYDDETPF